MAQQEMISIAKAVSEDAKLAMFDEPRRFDRRGHADAFWDNPQDEGKRPGIIYISHRLEELFEICDEVTVLKDGKFMGHKLISETNSDDLYP